jgi:hypothetical protein
MTPPLLDMFQASTAPSVYKLWTMRVCVDLTAHNRRFRNETLQLDESVPIRAHCGTFAACGRLDRGRKRLHSGDPGLIFNGSMLGRLRWGRLQTSCVLVSYLPSRNCEVIFGPWTLPKVST